MNNIKNWVPYKLVKEGEHLVCHWLNTFGKPFAEPFFEETILKCQTIDNRNFKHPSVSSCEMLLEWATEFEDVEPSAFVFHISRCGSTLAAQLLSTAETNIVLSEVLIFDDILQIPFKVPDFDQTAINDLFVNAIKYYGQERAETKDTPKGKTKRIFIKTASWHLFFYKQLRQIYPSIPFIFIYRSPDEVFSSHRKQPGIMGVRGLIEPQLFGFAAEEAVNWHPDTYLAKVLESYFRQFLEIIDTDNKFLLLNYNEGPMPMIEKIVAFTNTLLSPEDAANMTKRSLYHSKKPGERFSEKRVTDIPPCLINAMDLYNKLERKRKAMMA